MTDIEDLGEIPAPSGSAAMSCYGRRYRIDGKVVEVVAFYGSERITVGCSEINLLDRRPMSEYNDFDGNAGQYAAAVLRGQV